MASHIRHFGNTRDREGRGLVTVVCNQCGLVRAAEASVDRQHVLQLDGACIKPPLDVEDPVSTAADDAP